jgi:hypothetical protein
MTTQSPFFATFGHKAKMSTSIEFVHITLKCGIIKMRENSMSKIPPLRLHDYIITEDKIIQIKSPKPPQTFSQDGSFNPENNNISEAAFTKWATSLDWSVMKRGFPDYICWKNNEIIFVEVKPNDGYLSLYQQIVMHLLTSLGLQCFKWTPNQGLQKFEYDIFVIRIKEKWRIASDPIMQRNLCYYHQN